MTLLYAPGFNKVNININFILQNIEIEILILLQDSYFFIRLNALSNESLVVLKNRNQGSEQD